MIITVLDLIGSFAFAFYGATAALKQKYDIFGIFVCAFLTAVGGGTIRDMILNKTPFYLHDCRYLFVIIAAVAIAIALYKLFPRIEWLIQILDAVGLVVFAYIGVQKAEAAHLGIAGKIFFAPLTAAGGGLLRDIAMNRTPAVLYTDFYAEPAILFASLYLLVERWMKFPPLLFLLMLLIFTLRMVAVKFNFIFWVPHKMTASKPRKRRGY